MAGSTIDKHFHRGYQAALADMAEKLVSEGYYGMVQWGYDNARGEQTRELYTRAESQYCEIN